MTERSPCATFGWCCWWSSENAKIQPAVPTNAFVASKIRRGFNLNFVRRLLGQAVAQIAAER